MELICHTKELGRVSILNVERDGNTITIYLNKEYRAFIQNTDRDELGVPYVFQDIIAAVREELFRAGEITRSRRG